MSPSLSVNPVLEVEQAPAVATMTILIQRQLDTIATGNGAYLETYLRAARKADVSVRLVFAPWHAFGNRPWSTLHPRLGALVDKVIWPRTVRFGELYISVSARIWARFAVRLVQEALIRVGARIIIQSYLGKPLGNAEARITAAACDADPSSITVAEYSSLGPVLKLLAPGTVHACLMHDLLSDRGARFRAAGRTIDFVEVSRAAEIAWIDTCEALFFASANELSVVSKLLPKASHFWLRPDAPSYSPDEAPGPVRLVFIGTVHAGNEESIDHFIDVIWPLVRARLPSMELWIAGSIGKRLSPARAASAGVRILGRVERLETIGGAQSIGIAPTRMATGVSIKVAEYLLLGMTCVAYPLALEGFGDTLDDFVVRAGSSEAFCDAVIALAEDDAARRAMATRARDGARARLVNDSVVAYFAGLRARG